MRTRYQYSIGYFRNGYPGVCFVNSARVASKVARKLGASSYVRHDGDGGRRYVSLAYARGPDAAKPNRIPQRNATQRRRFRRGMVRRFGW